LNKPQEEFPSLPTTRSTKARKAKSIPSSAYATKLGGGPGPGLGFITRVKKGKARSGPTTSKRIPGLPRQPTSLPTPPEPIRDEYPTLTAPKRQENKTSPKEQKYEETETKKFVEILPRPEPCSNDKQIILSRNRSLLSKLKIFLNNNEEKLQFFRTLSSQYLQNEIKGYEYFQKFFDICSYNENKNKDQKVAIEIMFMELISLLPEIQKVNELYECYVDLKKKKIMIVMFP